MRVILKAIAIKGDNEGLLEIVYENDIVAFKFEGKELFIADWEDNLKDLFLQALHSFEKI